MSQTTAQQRQAWNKYECNPGAMTVIDFGPDRIRVAPPTVDAWHALAMVLEAHGYQIRVDDTDSYNCRAIKGGTGKSLHSYGIALDINWNTNPFKETPDDRTVRFSTKSAQSERAQDVKVGVADTDMTPDMIEDVLAIKTKNGQRVFEWGGNWKDRKDAMHFELDVSPAELEAGIDWNSVKKPPARIATPGQQGLIVADVSPTLMTGARGERVRQLQTALQQQNFPVGDIDGIYGTRTRDAVAAFQTAQGLAGTGVADQATLLALASAPTLTRQVEPGQDVALLDRLMQRLGQLEHQIIVEKARGDDTQLRPPGELTIFRSPGEVAIPKGPDDIGALLERLMTLVGRLQTTTTTTAPPSGTQPTDQLRKAVELLTTILAPRTDAKPPLGQVNGALGETLGNLLNGKKTAIGVLGAALTSVLSQVPAASGLGEVLAPLIPAVGLSPFAMPIFLGLSAWGVLGKFEKWAQGTAPPPST